MAENSAELRAAIDRHGANLAAWPDRALANRLRAAVLADRGLCAYLEDAVAIEDGLRAARDAVDAEIEDSGAAERVSAAVLARIAGAGAPRRHARWIAVAAAVVISACLGGVVELTLIPTGDQATQDVVVLDPIVFGTNEIGMQ